MWYKNRSDNVNFNPGAIVMTFVNYACQCHPLLSISVIIVIKVIILFLLFSYSYRYLLIKLQEKLGL